MFLNFECQMYYVYFHSYSCHFLLNHEFNSWGLSLFHTTGVFCKLINVGTVLYFPNMFRSVSAIIFILYDRLLDHIYDFRIKAMFGSSLLPVVCMID